LIVVRQLGRILRQTKLVLDQVLGRWAGRQPQTRYSLRHSLRLSLNQLHLRIIGDIETFFAEHLPRLCQQTLPEWFIIPRASYDLSPAPLLFRRIQLVGRFDRWTRRCRLRVAGAIGWFIELVLHIFPAEVVYASAVSKISGNQTDAVEPLSVSYDI